MGLTVIRKQRICHRIRSDLFGPQEDKIGLLEDIGTFIQIRRPLVDGDSYLC